MTEAEIRPGLRLNAAPALFIAPLGAVVVADVHWGYALSQRAAGRLVPVWGDDEIERRLEALLAYYRPRLLVVVGDVVHARAGGERAAGFVARAGRRLRVVLVAGNHDRHSGLATVETYEETGYFFHHGDRPRPAPAGCTEVVGHHHPAASWSDGAGARLKMPALVEGARRLILPAFSPWAGGVAWNDRLEPGERLWLIARRRIFPLAVGPAPGCVPS